MPKPLDAESKVEKLAGTLAGLVKDVMENGTYVAEFGVEPVWPTWRSMLPIAEALVKAAEALEGLLESPASFSDERIDYEERQVLKSSFAEARAALKQIQEVTK